MDKKTLTALCITIFVWGSAFVAIRMATGHYSAGGLALLRVVIGAVILLPITARYLFKKVDFHWMDVPRIIILATIGLSFYHFFLNYGERSISAGVASFLVGQAPIISAILAACFYKERVPVWGCVGLVISVAGVSLIALAGGGAVDFTVGLLAVIACAFCSGIYSVFIKPLLLRYHPMALTTYLMWSAILGLLPYGSDLAHDIETAPSVATWAVIYLGVFPTALGYMTWSYALTRLPTFRATCWMFMLPLVSCLLGWLVLSEAPDLLTFFGGVIAMGGAILVTLSKYKVQAIEKEEEIILEKP